MRAYKKRTKTTAIKTYRDYLEERKALISKGYYLKEQMSYDSFNAYYERIREAKRSGEIKSAPWQYLMSKEKFISRAQAKIFVKAMKEKTGKKITIKQAHALSAADIEELGAYINATKKTGLYGGSYE